jgi:three-Cys-motif partner protein
VWSIKKLLALDYYIGPFVKIMRSKNFSKLYYVDPFSGSGILKLKEKHFFPGSPLIPLFRYHETPFHSYYLSDVNSKYISALRKHMNRISLDEDADVRINKKNFSDLIGEVFSGERPTQWKQAGYLVFFGSLRFSR